MLPSLHTLLSAIVDYAGLFPPAKLDLREAMANYAHYISMPERWLLGRFVLPVSQLDTFTSLLPEFSLSRWPLSVIVGGEVEHAIAQIRACSHPQFSIQSLEFAPLEPDAIAHVLPQLPVGVESFFEVPWGKLDTYLSVLQSTQSAAKFRTGGLTAEAFPSSTQLARAVLECIEAQVSFKATAGLHHPLPGVYSLTYAPDSDTAKMHGFLNVALLAAIASQQAISLDDAVAVLEVENGEFQFLPEGVAWGDRTLSLTEIELARRNCFRAFGSCSFTEPLADLRALQLMD